MVALYKHKKFKIGDDTLSSLLEFATKQGRKDVVHVLEIVQQRKSMNVSISCNFNVFNT